MIQSREYKQNYLKEQIIDKCLNPEDFLRYCDTFKGGNIDEYTFEQLQYIVQTFQDLLIPNVSKEPETLNIEVSENTNDNDTYIRRISIEESKKKLDSNIYTINTTKLKENTLSSEEDIKITLGQVYESLDGALKGKNVYPVTSEPFGWIVERQVDDFVWLRKVLCNVFPGIYLPPSPPKRFRKSNDASNKQQYFLERFINAMTRNCILKRSTYLQSFLMEKDYQVFQEVKKKGKKLSKISRIEEYWTINGFVTCNLFNDESEKISLSEYLSVVESMKKKIKRASDEIINSLKSISNLIMEISKCYETLENVQTFISEVETYKPLYSSLKTSFTYWSEHELKSADLMKGYFNMFFKYGYYEVGPLKDIFCEREQKYENYEKAKSRLAQKKEKLWVGGDVGKWGLTNEDFWNASVLKNDKTLALSKMCKKESDYLILLRDEFAYINYQSKSEMLRVLKDNQLIENLHFTEFARSMCTHITKFHVIWGELIGSLSKIRTENNLSKVTTPRVSIKL
ncbi:hypothetical protein SteCoe_27564 [Stentor coeruleus]|uniref:PX domain-containing protein n=1 Tax=Stentor coeruleus TaxID=5963 RepID=A0A1R2BA96_9CILI|nr:hypothetical protein SteCoe_27564 [Stentor coeruleus]